MRAVYFYFNAKEERSLKFKSWTIELNIEPTENKLRCGLSERVHETNNRPLKNAPPRNWYAAWSSEHVGPEDRVKDIRGS